MVVKKQRLQIDSEQFLAKVKRNRQKAIKIVEKLVKQPLVFREIAKDFCCIVTDLLPIMKSTTDHSTYLDCIRKVEPILFSLNVMLKHNKVHYLLSDKNLFTSLKQVDKLLNNISPPFQHTILRDLSIQYRSQAEYNSGDAVVKSSPKQNETVDKSTENINNNEEDKNDIPCEDVTMKSTPTTTSSTPEQQSRRKSRKRPIPTSP